MKGAARDVAERAFSLAGNAANDATEAIAADIDGAPRAWLRRARPLLGTLVDIGVPTDSVGGHTAIDAAFEAIADVQASLSRFEPHSDLARFHALRRGASMPMRVATRQVLAAAALLHLASDGAFDISLGSAPRGWQCHGDRLHKLDEATRLDLGGIGKGHAVDRAVEALVERGCRSGWVNAGGDLRAFGAAQLPVRLRDETSGSVRPFAALHDGALATSCFGPGRRSPLVARAGEHDRSAREAAETLNAHVSVAAPQCLWADALTKIVALSGDAMHPLLKQFSARAWLH